MVKLKKSALILLVLCIFILGLSACYKDSDPELNLNYSPYSDTKMYTEINNNQYYWFYNEKFKNLSIETVLLSMGLHWFVEQYDEVYTGKEEYFYISTFDSPSVSTKDLVSLYNKDPERLYYIKPFLDCYLLMDKNKKPSDEDLKTIKETILYALDYYMNGKDFVGTLD